MENLKKAYSVSEAADVLGVSQWLVREAIRRGEIHCTRIGKRIIIPATAIDQFLALPDDQGGSEEAHPNTVGID